MQEVSHLKDRRLFALQQKEKQGQMDESWK